MSRLRAADLLFVLIAVSSATAVTGQGRQTGQITGRVADEGGNPLPGVTVAVTSAALMGERSAQSGANGDYVLRGLPPGVYDVVFELEGLERVEGQVTVELGLTAGLDATMQLARIQEDLVVTANAPNALENTVVGANLSDKLVDSLPIIRTPMEIADLAPGASDNTPDLHQVAISGGFAFDTVFLVDGVDINDNFFGVPVAGALPNDQGLFIEEAIEETQVLTSALPAEYGRFTGGVVNAITKSGGNEFEASLRVDFSNPSWRDETPLETELGETRDSNRAEVFSATFGGPIVKDRLWFFLAGRDTDTTNPTTFPVTGIPFPSSFEDQRWELKLSGSANDRHSFQLTYLDSDTRSFQRFPMGIEPRTALPFEIVADLYVLRWAGVLSPSLFAEVQVSEKTQEFVYLTTFSSVPREAPFLTLTIAPAWYNAPPLDHTDVDERDNEQIAASLSWLVQTSSTGSHDFQFGLERFTNINRGAQSFSPSDFFFVADYLADEGGNPIRDANGRIQPVFVPFGAVALVQDAVRGATNETETTSLYVSDRWRLNAHWSFNLGLRLEDVSNEATGAAYTIDTDTLMPRLAARYDPKGNGRFTLGAGYAHYSGMYNCAIVCRASDASSPAQTTYIYLGPPGFGIGFDPGFDLRNYFAFNVEDSAQGGVVFENGLHSPDMEELTLSAGMALPRGGWLSATFLDRSLEDNVDDVIRFENGQTLLSTPTGPIPVDNVVWANSNSARRSYQALQLQGRYRLTDRWTLDGNWTWQLENDGNFEGEGPNFPTVPNALDNYPEILAEERSAPAGRLSQFQRHKLRLWTNYGFDFDAAGTLDIGLLYRYNSPRTYSLVSFGVPVTPTQLSRDPGYAQPPVLQDIFFGSRGSEEFEASHVFDLALIYGLRLWSKADPWLKLEIRNVFNDDSLISFDTSVFPDLGGAVDAHGIPTEFMRGPNFGNARVPEDYVTPREFLVSVGVRF